MFNEVARTTVFDAGTKRNQPRFSPMVKAALRAGTLAAAALMMGCATLVNGTTQKVALNSNPEGADVLIDGVQHFTTPATVDLQRGEPHTLVFNKAGYQEDHEALTSSGTGWVWGNLLLGGFVGVVVDESNGAANKLSSDDVEVTMSPISSPATVSSTQTLSVIQPIATPTGPSEDQKPAGGAAGTTPISQDAEKASAEDPDATTPTDAKSP